MATLEENIRTLLQERKILLMTHLVLGYPSFEVNREVIRQMVKNGVDMIEMQIPFSEPVADGPMILKANQESISRGVKLAQCLEFAAEITAEFHIPFLFMTYYNILYKYGIAEFLDRAYDINIQGFIIPDLPPEEGKEYIEQVKSLNMAPIQVFAPTSTKERMQLLAQNGAGFIYCVARRGVTGKKTDFDQDFNEYIARCRSATSLPLAVGFGIRSKKDVDFLSGRADIAVIGTETIRLVDENYRQPALNVVKKNCGNTVPAYYVFL
jgi:tryptophan synthase alpha chain